MTLFRLERDFTLHKLTAVCAAHGLCPILDERSQSPLAQIFRFTYAVCYRKIIQQRKPKNFAQTATLGNIHFFAFDCFPFRFLREY